MPGRQPTLDEVAALAGVSRGTASRVINDAPHVSPSARAAVLDAIAQLGYAPNQAARSLVTRRADAVALAASVPDPVLFHDPFFAEIVLGVNQVLSETGLGLMLVVGETERQRELFARRLGSGGLDGVMLLCLHGVEELHRIVDEAGVPAVFCGRPLGFRPRWSVDADNRGGARLAAEHLLTLGRRRIATITGPRDVSVSVDRRDGFVEALEEAGREPVLAEGDYTRESGAHAMAALLESTADVDAVFAGSDLMAAGALDALFAAGRRVPDDVAVIGFDDLGAQIPRSPVPQVAPSAPGLTTVRQPLAELGGTLARLLVRVMAGEDVEPVLVPTTLVLRDTA